MNKKSIKFVLLFIIFLLIFLVILLFVLQKNQNNKTPESEETTVEPVLITDTSIKEVESISIYISVQEAINSYKSSSNVAVIPVKIYQKELSYNEEYEYYVQTLQYNLLNNSVIGYCYYVIDFDFSSYTYTVKNEEILSNSDYNERINKLISEDNGGITDAADNIKSKTVENSGNKFTVYRNDSLKIKIAEYYTNYFYICYINDENFAYALLDENYSTKRFSSIEEFKKSNIQKFELDMVNRYYQDGKDLYVAVNPSGNYFIIEESKPMDIKIMLDSYTTPLSTTIEKYQKENDVQKACTCLEQIKEMINNGDFKTLYSHLNKSFADNSFKDVNELKEYITKNYYKANNFEYVSAGLTDGYYVVTVRVVNKETEGDNFEVKYVVKLGTDLTNFELSFAK